jgi:hypothetical protein
LKLWLSASAATALRVASATGMQQLAYRRKLTVRARIATE